MKKFTSSRISEPSSWGGLGGMALLFAMSPQSIIDGMADVIIPWQLRAGAFGVAIVCFGIQIAMREWPNK